MEGEWFREWFGPLYEELYRHRDPDEAARQVASLLSWTGIPELPVLDAGCGAGRHLARLRARGCRAVGCDLSAHLLSRAVEERTGTVLRGDLRATPFRDGTFGLVAGFFSVFGYLETAEDDAALFRELARLVAPGGWLFLDLPDPAHVRANLVESDRRILGDLQVVQTRRIEGDRVVKTISVRRGDGPEEQYFERVRLWEMQPLDRLAEDAGMRRTFVMGDCDGTPAIPGCSRMAILWRKS